MNILLLVKDQAIKVWKLTIKNEVTYLFLSLLLNARQISYASCFFWYGNILNNILEIKYIVSANEENFQYFDL